jgi:threonine synthase
VSASYDEELADDVSRVRFELGDTTVEPETDALLSDETIEAVLAWKGYAAGVAFLAEGLITRFGQEPDSVRLPSGLTVSFRDRIAAWTRLAGRKGAQAVATSSSGDAGAAVTGDTYNQVVW